jgi:hypothetical protein
MRGEEVPTRGQDTVPALEQLGGEVVRRVLEILDLAAEKIGCNFHNGMVSRSDGRWQGLFSGYGKVFFGVGVGTALAPLVDAEVGLM